MTFNDLPSAMVEIMARLDRIEAGQQVTQVTQSQDEFLTVQETAEYMHVSIPTVYAKAEHGEWPHLKRGKRLYFLKEDLIKFLKDGRRKTRYEIQAEAEEFTKDVIAFNEGRAK